MLLNDGEAREIQKDEEKSVKIEFNMLAHFGKQIFSPDRKENMENPLYTSEMLWRIKSCSVIDHLPLPKIKNIRTHSDEEALLFTK